MTREFIWQSLEAPGWEHVRMIEDHPEWTVFDSILVRERDGQILRGGYTLVVDKQWRTLELRFMLETAPGTMAAVHILTEGDGTWVDADGSPLPELDGCLDIAISWSPLSYTLPLRRLGLTAGQAVDVSVACLSAEELTVVPTSVRYEWDANGLRCHEGGEAANLVTDDEGIVLEVAGAFHRTFPR